MSEAKEKVVRNRPHPKMFYMSGEEREMLDDVRFARRLKSESDVLREGIRLQWERYCNGRGGE